MVTRISNDNQSCWKTAKHPEKPLEKCVSKVSLSDPAGVQRNQKDGWSHPSHKYPSNNCNPQLFSRFACIPKSVTPHSWRWTALQLVSRSNTHFRLLSNSSFYRLSAVDISGLWFNTCKSLTAAPSQLSPSADMQIRSGPNCRVDSSDRLLCTAFCTMSDTLQGPFIET